MPKFALFLDGPLNGATTFDRQYVKEYDPDRDGRDSEGKPMRCHLVTTTNPQEALVFDTAFDALELWRKQSTREPYILSGIGKTPNRPLSMFSAHAEVIP